jgi:7,8-dihydroneopterin aldolase/epimerase/oxygenase
VTDEERSREQPFEVDVVVRLDVEPAVAGDDLERTVNYAALQALVVDLVGTASFRLIESLAAAIGEAVLGRWPVVSAVEIAVRKPEAPMPAPFERVEARIRLTRNA